MQITVACHSCDRPKRPLATCPACHAPALPEPELQAWRLSLHARHLARITREPVAAAVEPPSRARTLEPLRAVLVLDIEPVITRAQERDLAPIIPFEPSLPADEALSFNWDDDEPLWSRKSA
jgi:hypothetical protein